MTSAACAGSSARCAELNSVAHASLVLLHTDNGKQVLEHSDTSRFDKGHPMFTNNDKDEYLVKHVTINIAEGQDLCQ